MGITARPTPNPHHAATGLRRKGSATPRRALRPGAALLWRLCPLLIATLALIPRPAVADEAASSYRAELLAANLHWPTSVAKLPDGRYLVAERGGRILLVENGETHSLPGGPRALLTGGGGYFDILVDPAFHRTQTVFLTYSSGTATASTTGVFRALLEDRRLKSGGTILRAEPSHRTPRNYGGRMLYQAGRNLLVTVGDGLDSRLEAQSLYNEIGKVLRINEYGLSSRDNPFQHPGGLRVWSYGHRNPLGIAEDPKSGEIFIHDQGARGGDELNLLLPGRNYGWPAVARGVDFSGAQISPFKRMSGMEDPLWVWPRSVRPSGMAWYDGPQFPEWHDSLLVGSLKKPGLHRLRIHDRRVVDEAWVLTEFRKRVADVRVFPDDEVVLLTHEAAAQLLRIHAR